MSNRDQGNAVNAVLSLLNKVVSFSSELRGNRDPANGRKICVHAESAPVRGDVEGHPETQELHPVGHVGRCGPGGEGIGVHLLGAGLDGVRELTLEGG